MKNPLDFPIKNVFAKVALEKITGLGVLKDWYQQWMERPQHDHCRQDTLQREPPCQHSAFLDYTLAKLDARVDIASPQQTANLAQSGPAIFVANHPLGGIEGMLLAQLLLKFRPDLKVLTNKMLLIFPEFHDLFIGVDVLNPNKQRENAKGIRRLNAHLAEGGAVLIFPAGTVAQTTLTRSTLIEQPWHAIVGRLAAKHKAQTTPLYVNAKNPRWFYLSGLIHKRLRTALLARAMIAGGGARVDIRIGEAIPYDEVAHFGDAEAITDYYRLCCESLAPEYEPTPNKRALKQIKKGVNKQDIIAELEALNDYKLLSYKDMAVYCAPYAKLNCIMDEISVSREKTFRAVDEGTGMELDRDHYDRYYWHLWVWDHAKGELAGGYRMAKVDELVANFGINKLYSHSLYSYNKNFLENMTGAVEVGRSFVAPDYQRHPRVLDLLWKGIGAYIVANPGYHSLFGCVSISQQYSVLARAFLADSFSEHFAVDDSLKRGVQARKPLQVRDKPWSSHMIPALAEIPIINKLLGRIDAGKTIPVLIRHYLALNGRFISFSVNTAFNQSLDGLILVDLRKSPDKYLSRYLGKQGAEHFKDIWELKQDAA